MRLHFIQLCITAMLAIAGLASHSALAEHNDKPNFIIINLDDMHYNASGYTGSRVIKTPHIDRLCREGRFCTQGYATHGVCAPSRAGLMTGRYQARFGYETLSGGHQHAATHSHGVALSELTIADILKTAGYTSAAVGKWHLGENKQYLPLQRGFDYHVYPDGSHVPTLNQLKKGRSKLLVNEQKVDWPIQEDGNPRYKTDLMADYSIEWIKTVAGKQPFFLYLAPNAMHGPIEAPRGLENHGIHPYVGMMESVDNNVGRLIHALDEIGERGNTVIFFLNDNGGGGVLNGLEAHAEINNRPFFGSKADLWEGGVRVPFAIHWPGHIEGGDFTAPVITLDILPTMAAAANIELPKDRDYDGINLLPALSGRAEPIKDRVFIWRWGKGYGVRKGDMKLIWQRNSKMVKAAKVLMGGRDIESTDRDSPFDRQNGFFFEPELYDLSKDPGEENDIAAQLPEIVKAMKKHVEEFDAIALPHTEEELAIWPASADGLDIAKYQKRKRLDKIEQSKEEARSNRGKRKKNSTR